MLPGTYSVTLFCRLKVYYPKHFVMSYRTQDAEFCGKVPLNQTNIIQSHGVLLVLKKVDFTIIQVSENAVIIFDKPVTALINTFFGDYQTDLDLHKLKEHSAGEIQEGLPFTLTIAGKDFLSLIHTKQEYLILEIELPLVKGQEQSFINVYQELRYVMGEVNAASTTKEACRKAIRELKRITGFDKIMIYQFDDEWAGTVIAEEMEEGMNPYLGLRFPASDVPKQARDLYLKNPYRFIPNVNYSPVKLYPLLNPVTKAFLDLSDTNLRSVAAVHIEYLKNMEVMASMSTRIIQDGKLWGLISCHHRAPKYLSYEICFVFELVSNVISAKIAAVQNADSTSYQARLSKTYQSLIEKIFVQQDLQAALQNNKQEVSDLLQADGVAIVFNKHITLAGVTPSLEQVENLMLWLRMSNIETLYNVTNLSANLEEAEAFAHIASGLLVLPIRPDKGIYILAFRPEAVQKIGWGGNPNEAIVFEEDRKKYHPRNSFRLWEETVKNTALPWKNEELQIADNFRNFLSERTLNNV